MPRTKQYARKELDNPSVLRSNIRARQDPALYPLVLLVEQQQLDLKRWKAKQKLEAKLFLKQQDRDLLTLHRRVARESTGLKPLTEALRGFLFLKHLFGSTNPVEVDD